jgi:hypothetical protein
VTGIAQQDFDLLRGAIDGPVIGPADVDNDNARKVLNAVIDRRFHRNANIKPASTPA